jgi:hypothetical protein
MDHVSLLDHVYSHVYCFRSIQPEMNDTPPGAVLEASIKSLISELPPLRPTLPTLVNCSTME